MTGEGPLPGHDPATICFPVRERDGRREVLLIEKRRGVGAGLYNGPGGKVEPGETVRACAVRETEEEVRATPTGLAKRAELHFRFGGDPFMYVHAFVAGGLEGTPESTPEADPEWIPVEDVPYGEMWEDDREWLPPVLAGETVRGRFQFTEEGDELLGFDVATGVDLRPADAVPRPRGEAGGG
jgi:8-oxo-dGTP diphosphatase